MSKLKKKYNPACGLWYDQNGIPYIKNEFNVTKPIWLKIKNNRWSVNYLGNKYYIDWDDLGLSEHFLHPFKEILKIKLKSNSVRYIDKTKHMIKGIRTVIGEDVASIGELGIRDFVDIWKKLNSSDRIFIREFYTEMVNHDLGGVKNEVALELRNWKARSDVKFLRDVLEWNETKGALTNSEAELVRQALLKPLNEKLTDSNHAGRLLTWIMFETLKRGVQITQMIDGDLIEISDDVTGVSEWMLKIPMAKKQTGMDSQWWPISHELAKAIQDYQNRPSIRKLQKKFQNLILWKTVDLERGGLSAQSVRTAINNYIKRLNVTSPRTKKKIQLTPTRIRHTGATLLAKNGVSRDVIQEILEHDSTQSADAYIDACGSELIPAIDRIDRASNTFNDLANAFFKGATSTKLGSNPIYVPIVDGRSQPALIGDCGNMNDCPRHPFHACYDGCVDFIAWSDGNHNRALEYAKNEQSKWEKAEGKERVNAPKNFERLRKAIEEVIEQIKLDKKLL